MKRLYVQIYLTIVGSLLLVVLTAGLLWHFLAGVPPFGQPFEIAGEVLAELVPAANAPISEQQQAIERWAQRLNADLALYGRANEPLAAAGRPLPAPSRGSQSGGWLRTPAGPAVFVRLSDGRRLLARIHHQRRLRAPNTALLMGSTALVVALGALKVVR